MRTFGYTSFVVDPPNGHIAQVTPAPLTRRKAMANVGKFGQGPKAKGLPIPPRTMGMEVYSGGQVEGRRPVRALGAAR